MEEVAVYPNECGCGGAQIVKGNPVTDRYKQIIGN